MLAAEVLQKWLEGQINSPMHIAKVRTEVQC